MKTRTWLPFLLLTLFVSTKADAQYSPAFNLDTIDVSGAYDVHGTAVDDDQTIYLLDPCLDRIFAMLPDGTALGDFSTEVFGAFDGEGLAIDPGSDQLYICDPVCNAVLVVQTDGIFVTSFDTAAFGSFDPHGAAFDPIAGELYVLDPVCDQIFVTTPTGTPLRNIPTDSFGCFDGSGLAYDPGRNVLLISDPVCGAVFEINATSEDLLRVVDTESDGLFDVQGAGLLAPSTLVLTDPVCDNSVGLDLPVDLADHNIGNMVLTMTDQGSMGFLDDLQAAGTGLIYPAGSTNKLYIGSLWVGRDATYVANRDYSADPDEEWTIEAEPDGQVRVESPGVSADQEIHAGFNDDLASNPFGMYIRQESWAFSSADDDDFVIVRYFIHNRSSADLTELRAGLFLDIDIDAYQSNTGSTDPARDLAYMTDVSGVHLGIGVLSGDQSPDPVSNLTLIHNPTFVYPQTHVLDIDKFGFLTASDPAHSVPDAPVPDDYSLLVAVGPFSLAPQDSNEVTFVIAGGASLAELQANVDRAQFRYSPTVGIAETSPGIVSTTRLVQIAPNPFNPMTTIRYRLARDGQVRLVIYDPMGRTVRTLVDGHREAGRHELVWAGRGESGQGIASGVYFLKLETGDTSHTRRLVLLK